MAKAHRIAVVVNASGGKAAREGEGLDRRLVEAFAAHGVRIDPQMAEGKAIAQAIADLKTADVVALGGGDGTLGGAAGLLGKSGQIMAVRPLGTLNHLSADLGIPADLQAAALSLAAWGAQGQGCGVRRAGRIALVHGCIWP